MSLYLNENLNKNNEAKEVFHKYIINEIIKLIKYFFVFKLSNICFFFFLIYFNY